MRCLTPALVAALLGAVVLQSSARAQAVETDIDMVISLDRSESISAEEAEQQIDGLIYALTHERFVNAVRSGFHGRIGFAVIKWSSFARSGVLLPWTLIATRADADRVAARLKPHRAIIDRTPDGSQTDIAWGIEVATEMHRRAPYRPVRKLTNLVADGVSNIGRVARVGRDAALAEGIVINGLIMAQGSAIRVLTEYFEREVIGGPRAFVLPFPTYDAFADAMLRKMILEVALMNGLGRQRAAVAASDR